ncbi:hypothetical protein MNBD_NITROSPINAE01-798 [hydrothermal vent metagenome]|uniref:Uncharacterized protein n=1 Tax=hydrothermal vent metagenome TaxID=652676 RepID=A0A3B1CE37_9ZZZZ
MSDLGARFPAALAIFAAGVAGFISMIAGTEIMTAVLRATGAGIAMYIVGKLIALALFEERVRPITSAALLAAKKREAEERGGS